MTGLVYPIFFVPNLVIMHIDGISKVVYTLKIGVALIIFSRELVLAKEALELILNGTHLATLVFKLLLSIGLDIITCISWKCLG